MLAVGDALFRGTKVPICWHDRDLCCLLVAKAGDATEKMPQLVRSTDYYSLLLFCVSKSDTSSWNLGRFKEDYKILEVPEKSIGVQAIFSSILPVRGKGALLEAQNQIVWVNRSTQMGSSSVERNLWWTTSSG